MPRCGHAQPGVRADAPANGFDLAIVVAARRSTCTLGLLGDAVAREREKEGAKFVRYFGPLLNALRGLGGSAKADEAVDRVAEDLKLSDDVLNEVLPSGGSRFRNQVA